MSEKETSKITTIKIRHETKARLEKLRAHKRESYEEITERMLNLLNLCRINPELAQIRLKKMEIRQRRLKRASEKYSSSSQVMQKRRN